MRTFKIRKSDKKYSVAVNAGVCMCSSGINKNSFLKAELKKIKALTHK
ncbi:MAG: hypothetical protein IKS41_06495 [Alphaproteobacteria bacterium]|nr:hypothetical protein [Alphaproteobacteria bacterium]